MAVDFSKGAEAVAQRMINAENNIISNLMDLGGLSRNEAEKAFAKLKSVGAFKMDAVNGRYIVKHGAYMERDVIRRAAGRADSIEARLDSLVETVNSLGKQVAARVDTARADATYKVKVKARGMSEKEDEYTITASSEFEAGEKARKKANKDWGGGGINGEKAWNVVSVTRSDSERADADRSGQRVKIKGGMKEFVGKTGTIVMKEGGQYRVKLDSPVEIPGVGMVKDDLWDGNMLQNLDR